MKMTKTIALLGCGAIGTYIATFCEDLDVVGRILVYDEALDTARERTAELSKVTVVDSFEELLAAELVVEAASQEAVKARALDVLGAGVDLLTLSVGAFVDSAFHEEVKAILHDSDSKLYIPSGAIGSIDVVKAAALTGIEVIEIETRKPASALFKDGKEITQETVVFQGTAQEAVKLFPKNINVAACLSLACGDFSKVKVKIIVDPWTKRNTHSLYMKGEYGSMRCEFQNLPLETNPASSRLAALSAISTIQQILEGVRIGS